MGEKREAEHDRRETQKAERGVEETTGWLRFSTGKRQKYSVLRTGKGVVLLLVVQTRSDRYCRQIGASQSHHPTSTMRAPRYSTAIER
jgi:hypothetical protein